MSVVYSNFCGMVVSETRGGVDSDYISDPLGSTIGLMGSTGTMTDRWEYWPYGEVVSRTGSNATPLTFLGVLGYFQDVLSKLFYVRARHLRVDLARWLTADPIWPVQPPYSYAANGPTYVTDPSGLDTCDVVLANEGPIGVQDNSACLWALGLVVAVLIAACVVACATGPIQCGLCIVAALVIFTLGLRYCFDKYCIFRLQIYKQFCLCKGTKEAEHTIPCSVCMSAFIDIRQCKDLYHEYGWQYPVTNCNPPP